MFKHNGEHCRLASSNLPASCSADIHRILARYISSRRDNFGDNRIDFDEQLNQWKPSVGLGMEVDRKRAINYILKKV